MIAEDLIDYSIRQIKRTAYMIADKHKASIALIDDRATGFTTREIYARRTHDFGITLPDSLDVEIALRKLSCPKFWKRNAVHLTRLKRQERDLGVNIGADKSPYTSRKIITWGREQDAANQEFMNKSWLINKSTGQKINMGEMNKHKGRIRFSEIYGIVKSMTGLLADQGYEWTMITLTLPPRYHPRPASGKSKWDGSTILDGQNELKRRWHNVRQAVLEAGIDWYGLRGVEPHKDGCAHWHILALYKPEDKAIIQDAFTRQIENDRELDWADRDPNRDNPASAATYICKYITKNIDESALTGAAISDSTDPQDALKRDSIMAVKHWRRTNRIRAFQFFGFNGGITKWRILRKMDMKPKTDVMGELWQAAKDADWMTFLQGHEDIKIISKTATNTYGEEYQKPAALSTKDETIEIENCWSIVDELDVLTVVANDPRGKAADATPLPQQTPLDDDGLPF